MATFFIRKGTNNQFYFYLRADNGEIVVTSEMYTTKASAKTGIESVKKNAAGASVVEVD